MISHTNYSRAFCREADRLRNLIPRMLQQKSVMETFAPVAPELHRYHAQQLVTASLLAGATKIVLPSDGIVLDDKSVRALRGDLPLSLPFDSIALEYTQTAGVDRWIPTGGPRIVLAVQEEHEIQVHHAFILDEKRWRSFHVMAIPRVGCLVDSPEQEWTGYEGRYVRVRPCFDGKSGPGERMIDLPAQDPTLAPLRVLLGVLNALACTNVSLSDSPLNNAKRPKKAALPFDSYKILTLGDPAEARGRLASASGDRRTSREHLRRGHIRRLLSGACVWVNAHVVNAGVGGKVKKDYAMTRMVAR